jgi:hypothetical protein
MFLRCVTAVTVLGLMGTPAQAEQQEKKLPVENPLTRTLQVGEWEVSVTRIPTGNPGGRVMRYHTRFFVSRVSAQEKWLAHETNGPAAPSVLTVLPDGTLLLTGTPVTWVPWKGKARHDQFTLDGESMLPVVAWPDGLVAYPYVLNRANPFYFVPIEGLGDRARLNLAKRVRLTDDAGTCRHGGAFTRHGDTLVWLKNRENGKTEGLCRFDLGTGKRECFPLSGQFLEIVAFDGRLATLRDTNTFIVFNLEQGRPAGVAEHQAPLAEREGFRYYLFHERKQPKGKVSYTLYTLVALDLRMPGADARVLRQFPQYQGHPEPRVTDTGIEVSDGKARVVVPWAAR